MILMDPKTLERFACPLCHAALEAENEGLRCTQCRAGFPVHNGFLDFSPEIKNQPGLAQKFMESAIIVSLYERWFRPLFTRLGSSIHYVDEMAYLVKYFQPVDGPILDLACGTGFYSRFLAGRVGADRLVGLDLSFAMIQRARQEADAVGKENLRFVRGSAMALPFADASLGAVNCFGALHLFPDPAQAIGEIGRVLQSGGTFTGLTARWRESARARKRQEVFARFSGFKFFDDGMIRRSVEQNGMRLVDIQSSGMLMLFAARKM